MLKDFSIIIPVAPNEDAHEHLLEDLKHTKAEIIISSEGSRARSLNEGAKKAKNKIFCFLHADTKLTLNAITALDKIDPNSINYFRLSYDGGLAELNAIGANIRSKIFGFPYGDQGFTLTKSLFETIGGFPDMPYGEDLLFIRKAKKASVKLNSLSAKLITSPRKYKEAGWLKLTMLRQYQLFKLMKHPL